MSLLRLSRRWFVNEVFPDINTTMDYSRLWNIFWFFWTNDALCSFSIFSKITLMSSVVKFLVVISKLSMRAIWLFMSFNILFTLYKTRPPLTTFEFRMKFCQTFKIGLFAKTVSNFQQLTISENRRGFEYAFGSGGWLT